MSEMPVAYHMHTMITVSDMERSVAFYTGAFGFNVAHVRHTDDGYESALQLDVVRIRETYLVLDKLVIVLCSFDAPAVIPVPGGPFDQAGLKRIAFGVSDLAEAARRVEAHGSKILEHTRTHYEQHSATLVVVTDPDGIALEIVQRTASPG